MANTLRQLQEEGKETFYGGKLGQRVIDELQKLGSKMTLKDLSDYK